MKRLVWVLLVAFGTALAQVQPVDLTVMKAKPASCCEAPGACCTPYCTPVPARAQPITLSNQVRAVADPAVSVARTRESFFLQFSVRASTLPALPMTPALALPASVPLFQEHCSWLI